MASAINQKRWAQFKANNRAWYSLWIFLFLFTVCLFAEFIANDKPIFIEYNGQWYSPVFKTYSEQDFGGEFDLEADYRDPYIQSLINDAGGKIIWPLIPYHYSTINYNLPTPAPSAPSSENWLGTDDKGQDVLARVIYGFRLSILFGFAVTLASAIIGIALGAVQGFYGGWVDLALQRFMEIWGGLPQLFMLIILVNFIVPNLAWLVLITLLFGWMGFVGVVRAEFLRCRNFEYVQAAKAMGMSDTRLMKKHILPNAMSATLAMLPFSLSGSVTILTSLDFLGFGLPPGEPSLGELLAQGKANIQAPWLGFTAFGSLGGILMLLVFIGEGIRDAFDPRNTFA
ncbi:ABC transporter permease [Gayadomonas joobiniege]|uniref:ABC transporter permease n=1 Tax=Gayadomonas joobiniege TaxID=1234606 RepID=UPI00036FE011|nr:ABC transporter permease [Gayadomonas joobiniege]